MRLRALICGPAVLRATGRLRSTARGSRAAAADLAGRPRLALLGAVFGVSLFVPVLHLLALALTFGALGPVLLLGALPLSLAAALAAEGPAGVVG